MDLTYLAGQNLKRRPTRTLLMALSVALATATLVSASVVSRGIERTLQTARQRLGADLVVVPAGSKSAAEAALISGSPTTFYMDKTMEQKVAAVPGVDRTTPQLYLRSLDAPCCVALVHLVGFRPDTDLTVEPWLMAHQGKTLAADEMIVGSKVVSTAVGAPVSAMGLHLVFLGKPFTVAGVLDSTGMGTDFTVFIPMETAYRMTQGSPLYPVPVSRDQISTVLVRVKPAGDLEKVAQRIEGAVPGVEVLQAGELTRSLDHQLRALLQALLWAGGILWFMSLGLVASLLSAAVNERRREFGLLRAVGARRQAIFRLVMMEAGLLAGLGGLAGVTLGALLGIFSQQLITFLLGAIFTFPGWAYLAGVSLAGLVLALLTGVAGGLQPALAASRLEPYEVIRGGE